VAGSTIHAHPFIAESYWHDSVAMVRDVYLPSAQHLGLGAGRRAEKLQRDGVPLHRRAVRRAGCRRQGIGSALLAKSKSTTLANLEVYQKNVQAVNFYHAQGFRIEDCAWQDDTQHPTWIMHWPADQMP
jgi:putative acetyltransferase